MPMNFLFLSNILYTSLVFLGKDVTVLATETTFKGAVKFSHGDFITYANFVPFHNHKLNHSLAETRMVNSELDCIETCSDNDSCLSANFKTTPEANNKFVCEVLTTNKFTSYKLFMAALGFNHYSFTVSLLQFYLFFQATFLAESIPATALTFRERILNNYGADHHTKPEIENLEFTISRVQFPLQMHVDPTMIFKT